MSTEVAHALQVLQKEDKTGEAAGSWRHRTEIQGVYNKEPASKSNGSLCATHCVTQFLGMQEFRRKGVGSQTEFLEESEFGGNFEEWVSRSFRRDILGPEPKSALG